MVALETLRNINKDLSMVQSEISTGKSISSAKDNAAVWSISTVMSSDVNSFEQITDSLNLGSSTVGVARSAAEQITEMLTDMKALIVGAQEENVDTTKIQTDIVALRDQITSIVGAAQFNGQNLIDGSDTADMQVLASLDRSSSGVTASYIDVARNDLSLTGTVTPANFGGTPVTDTSIINNDGTAAGSAATLTTGNTQDLTIASVADGYSYRITLDDSAGANVIGSQSFSYVAGTSDSLTDVAANLNQQISDYFAASGGGNYTVSVADEVLSITNSSGDDLSVTATTATGGDAEVNSGALSGLSSIDVTTDASGALGAIEDLISTAVDAAAAFGSAQSRIEMQGEFVNTLIDSMTTGIGAMVDADMEAASAKLQALQVQQQLGTQALSIANSAPQNLLSLFR
ncbi:MAG: flagellin [Henriciella sp.]